MVAWQVPDHCVYVCCLVLEATGLNIDNMKVVWITNFRDLNVLYRELAAIHTTWLLSK